MLWFMSSSLKMVMHDVVVHENHQLTVFAQNLIVEGSLQVWNSGDSSSDISQVKWSLPIHQFSVILLMTSGGDV